MSDTELAIKKPKKSNIADNYPSGANIESKTTCAYFVKRKKRYCKMTVSKDKQYCGEHEPTTSVENSGAPLDTARIPCPFDPKHTVCRNKLQKHLRVCNSREKDDIPTYIKKGLNAGGPPSQKDDDYSKLKISELNDTEFYGLIEKVHELYKKYVAETIETLECGHHSLGSEIAKNENGKEARKHLMQTSALLGILEQQELFRDRTSFLEFGAGKGQLAYYLVKALQEKTNVQVILLDRKSLRHKKDNKIEDKSLVHRIRVDIADFDMRQLNLLHHSERLVAVSKHLCGAATDLTLRCITQSLESSTSRVSPTTKSFPDTEFVLIALCCHHRCDWTTFVGKEFFRSNDINQREFTLITKMASWAICGTGMSRERRRLLEEKALSTESPQDNAANQRLSLKERENIGFMCKRVLDHARLMYLKQYNFDASLKYYVGHDVTLENVCLIAKKENKSHKLET